LGADRRARQRLRDRTRNSGAHLRSLFFDQARRRHGPRVVHRAQIGPELGRANHRRDRARARLAIPGGAPAPAAHRGKGATSRQGRLRALARARGLHTVEELIARFRYGDYFDRAVTADARLGEPPHEEPLNVLGQMTRRGLDPVLADPTLEWL